MRQGSHRLKMNEILQILPEFPRFIWFFLDNMHNFCQTLTNKSSTTYFSNVYTRDKGDQAEVRNIGRRECESSSHSKTLL